MTQVRTWLIVAAWLTLSAQLAGGPAALVALDCLSAPADEITACCHGDHPDAACPMHHHAEPGEAAHSSSHDEERQPAHVSSHDEPGAGGQVGHQCRTEVSILQNLLGPVAVLSPAARHVLLPPAPGLIFPAAAIPDDVVLSPPLPPPRA